MTEAEKRADRKRRSREHYLRNKELYKDRAKKWAAENPDKVRETQAKNYERRKDYVNARSKRWQQANKERLREYNARRRVRVAKTELSLTVEQQANILAFYAKAKAMTELSGIPYEVDHIKPLSKGGLHHPDNLRVITRTANRKKGARLL